MASEIKSGSFGTINGNTEVRYWKMINSKGEYVKVLNLGGIINELYVLDREGNPGDIVLGYDTPQKYYDTPGYQGAIIGRFCNRIGGGKFTVNGKEYELYKNEYGKNTLHGGRIGFDKAIWDVTPVEGEGFTRLILRHTSPDADEGFPGELTVEVTYTFTDDSRFSIHYDARTTKSTPINLTNHAYFNLNGVNGGSCMSDILWIDSDEYLEYDEEQIPFGTKTKVDGTRFDYRIPRAITQGLDHNFCLSRANGMVRKSGELYDDRTGRRITVYTNSPALQVYTGLVMNNPTNFKGNVPQKPLCCVCLETQFYPDSPNKPAYPSCILNPGEIFDFTTVYEFSNI